MNELRKGYLGMYEGFRIHENFPYPYLEQKPNMKLLKEQILYPKKSWYIIRSSLGLNVPMAFVIQHFQGGRSRTFFTPVEVTNEA